MTLIRDIAIIGVCVFLQTSEAMACLPMQWQRGSPDEVAAALFKYMSVLIYARVEAVSNETPNLSQADISIIEVIKGTPRARIIRMLRLLGTCSQQPFTVGETALFMLDDGPPSPHPSLPPGLYDWAVFRDVLPPDELLLPRLRALRDLAP